MYVNIVATANTYGKVGSKLASKDYTCTIRYLLHSVRQIVINKINATRSSRGVQYSWVKPNTASYMLQYDFL